MTRFALALALLAVGIPLLAMDGGFVWRDADLVAALPAEPSFQAWLDAIAGPYAQDAQADPGAARYYRPLVSLGFQFQRQLFGDWPIGFRLTNLLSHVLCVLLVLRFVRLRVPDAAPWMVALATVPFALHPSRVQGAAYISGLSELWMTLFVLLAADAARRRVLSFLTMVMSVLAVLCKETAVVLPLVLAIDAWAEPRPRRDGQGERPVRLGPSFASAAGVGFALLLRSTMVRMPPNLFHDLMQQPLRPLAALGQYLGAAFSPFPPVVVIAPDVGQVGSTDVAVVAGAAVGCAMLVGALLVPRWPAVRPFIGDLAWLVVPLLPVLGLLATGLPGLASGRLLYLPLAGVCLLVARALSHLPRPGLWAIAVGVWVVGLGYAAVPFARAFRSDQALWHYELSHAPRRVYAVERLGMLAEAQGRADEALDRFVHGCELAHAAGGGRVELRLALRAADTLLSRTRGSDEQAVHALQSFYAAVTHGGFVVLPLPGAPHRFEVTERDAAWAASQARLLHVPAAGAHVLAGDFAGARQQLQRALELDPDSREGWALQVRAMALSGDLTAARRQLRDARVALQDDAALPELADRLQRARSLRDGTRGDPLVEVQTALLFDAPAHARRLLQTHAELADLRSQWWVLGIRAALADDDRPAAEALRARAAVERQEFVADIDAALSE